MPPAGRRGERAPWSQRAVDGACLGFALFTVACHASVWLGGSLRAALAASAAGGAAFVALRLARRGSRADGAPDELRSPAARGTRPEGRLPDELRSPAARCARPEGRLPRWVSGAALALALAGALASAARPLAFWWCALAALSLGAASLLGERPRAEAPAARSRLEAGLWGLALACAALALVAHRVDLDDAFYVNLAAAAADAPGAPLLAGDTLHGVPGLPLHLPVYRLHSWELWNGALAAASGLPPIACFHFVSAALAAALAPLSLARLARLLTPRHWLATVAATLFVLVAAGEVHRWYGNFAFVRIWQGKAVLLSVFLPLVHAYAIEFALRPGRATFLRLAAAQVAALGCSATALWLAPAGALAAAACALRPTRGGLARLGLVLLSSGYVLAAGVLARAALAGDADLSFAAEFTPEMALPDAGDRHAPGAQLAAAFDLVLGSARLRVAGAACWAAVWLLCPAGLARRYAVVVPLATTLVLLDPYATRWLTQNLTGAAYWRALWALPLPLLLGLALTAPLRAAWLPRRLRALALAAACALFALGVPATSGLGAANGVELGWPRLKVPPEAWRWAELLTERAGPGAVALAPAEVSPWLATFRGRVHPLVVRALYLPRYARRLGADSLEQRVRMVAFAGGELADAESARAFAAGLERFAVRAVLLRRSAAASQARASLRAAGFTLDLQAAGHEIWLRAPGA
jgi:hypothetical protein